MLKFLTISCKKATEICDKAQYNEASLFEKIQLNFHLASCKKCATYSSQNNMLTRMIKGKACEEHKFGLDSCMKEQMKEALKDIDS